jgi:hypothetical protein
MWLVALPVIVIGCQVTVLQQLVLTLDIIPNSWEAGSEPVSP